MDVRIGASTARRDRSDYRDIGASENRIPDTPAALELHIEELVLHGFPSSDRSRIGDAVERELSRLIEAQGLALTGPVSMERLDAGAFKVAANATPRHIGTQVAHNLHRGLSAPPKIQPGGDQKRTRKR